MTVYPGLIDSETRLGLSEIASDRSTNDTVESSEEIFPQMHVYDAFHAESEHIPITRYNGITNAVSAGEYGHDSGTRQFYSTRGARSRRDADGEGVALAMNFGQARQAGAGGAWQPAGGRYLDADG
jgi:hypothetical protein